MFLSHASQKSSRSLSLLPSPFLSLSLSHVHTRIATSRRKGGGKGGGKHTLSLSTLFLSHVTILRKSTAQPHLHKHIQRIFPLSLALSFSLSCIAATRKSGSCNKDFWHTSEDYGVAMTSRLLKNIGLWSRISSLS